MVFVNGQHPIIILESGEELLSNNSNICVIQSNQKWDPDLIEVLRNQKIQGVQVLYLHGGTRDVQIPTDDKNAQKEPTNDSSMFKVCSNLCKHWDLPWFSDICAHCERNCATRNKGYVDNWEAKNE